MEEIQSLVNIIKSLPTFATWILLGFFAYKITIIGSIYGVIRYCVGELFSWLKMGKIESIQIKELTSTSGDKIRLMGDDLQDCLVEQLMRIKRETLIYIHKDDIEWLKQAIDKQLELTGKRKY
jgi:hypothetical protein